MVVAHLDSIGNGVYGIRKTQYQSSAPHLLDHVWATLGVARETIFEIVSSWFLGTLYLTYGISSLGNTKHGCFKQFWYNLVPHKKLLSNQNNTFLSGRR